MLSYLQAQTRKNKIPAGVEGVKTANKTGELDASYLQLVENDAAIVYKEGCPYILVVMSQGISNSSTAVSNIVQISKIAYQNIGKETEKEKDKDKEDKGKKKDASGEKHIVAVVGGHGNAEGSQQGWYTSGTSDTTGTTNPAWEEKDLTKKVADYVKKVMEEQYPQFTVVTDGYSQKNTDRLKIAKQKGAELFIGVHFNSNSNSSAHGTGIYYQQNTSLETENVKLATALLNSITGEMKTDVCEGVSASSYNAFSGGLQEEFGGPAVYTEAAFMSNKGDMEIIAQSGNKGLKAYGNGIIDGILTYYGLENKGYGDVDIEDTKGASTSNGSEQITTTVDTKIYDLQFLAEEEFDKLVEDNDPMALDYYTLDSDWQLITAKWSYNPTDEVQISKNPPINYRSVLSKYTTPFEYLMDFYIDIKDDEFISDFADLALESEFIIAVRDDVTTTETDTSSYIVYEDGETTDATSEQSFSETVTTSVELTYADNWFVNFSRDITYKIDKPKSDDEDDIEDLFELVNTTQEVLGKSSESTSTSTGSAEGPTKTGIDEEGNEITISSTEYTTTTRHSISVKYAENEGEGEVRSNEDKFYKLFDDNPEAQGSLKDTWLVRIIENGERTAQFTDLTKYLLYHITGNKLYKDVSIDDFLEKYKYNDFVTVSEFSTDIPLYTPVLSKEDFIAALKEYAPKASSGFNQYFLPRAAEIYDWGIKYGINPELLITFAIKESSCNWTSNGYNFWGVDSPNSGNGKFYDDMEKAAARFAEDMKSYAEGGSYEGRVMTKYNDRLAANCNSNGYGLPGTLKGALSCYSDLIGDYNGGLHCEGDSNHGGQYYIHYMYPTEEEYREKCGFGTNAPGAHTSSTPYTIQEKADYTAWLYENQLKYWKMIFGKYGTLGAGNIKQICQQITEMYNKRGTTYGAQTYWNIKKTYESDTSIVCTTYVCVVLYKAGLIPEDVMNRHNYHYTVDMPNLLRDAGWHEVDKSDLQPGDVLNKPGDEDGHTVIYVGDGLIYDEKSCTYNTSTGRKPSGIPYNVNGYIGPGYVAWRRGNK